MHHLLLLHGAIGSKTQFEPLVKKLENRFIVHTLDFAGHGGSGMPESFGIEQFSLEVAAYIEKKNLGAVAIFGYSMGGYVALYLARHEPEKIGRIMTLATKFLWNPEIAATETKMLDAQKIIEKVPAFASILEKRHQPNDWKIVLSRTAEMMIQMGNHNPLQQTDYPKIIIPVRIAIGDKDAMVSLEETMAVYRQLPNASFLVLPETAHPIEKVDMDRLSDEIHSFFI